MNNTMGIINNFSKEMLLNELMKKRSLGAVYFGGRYRLTDFILSNMTNSGIKNVGVIVNNDSRSLMGHLRYGKEWNLNSKREGLFILPPGSVRYFDEIPKGDIEILYENIVFLKRRNKKYVLFAEPNMIYNMDFNEVLNSHMKNKADITLIYKDMHSEITEHSVKTVITTDKNNKITSIEMNPAKISSTKESMGAYLMEKDLFIDLIYKATSQGKYDFKRDCIFSNVNNLNIVGYEHTGYFANIHSIKSYYKYNMDLLNIHIAKELFFKQGMINTSIKDQPPVKYTEDSKVKNSLIANGCIIEGNVENSILFRGVHVEKGANVKNSIVMHNSIIQSYSNIDTVILDKEVVITKGKRIIGTPEYPIVIEKTVIL